MTTFVEPAHQNKPPAKDRHPAVAQKARRVQPPSAEASGDILLQRSAQCACGGDCPRCEQKSSNNNNLLLQTKLRVSSP
ncbi:MAG: hypothetical protein JOZ52_02450, partial [Acidobacteria bacterium]|nr:hypothetical protein [Acidobacteriota bacterium]